MNLDKLSEPIALVDMDGTLCDFDGAMQAQLALLRGPDEPAGDFERDQNLPHIKARRRLVKNQPGFWRDLKPLQLGFDVLEELRSFGFRPHILTKGPRTPAWAWSEKVEWCKKYVPDLPIVMSEDKGLVYGKILVDDWPEYICRWLEWRPRGLVIVPAHHLNVDIEKKFPDNCIRFDGSNLAAVHQRIESVSLTLRLFAAAPG